MEGDETDLKIQKMNNKGFTLIETTVCFILLSILLVAASQVIASSSEVYFYTKSTGYGVQVAQAIATEIRGDLEDAVIQKVDITLDNNLPAEASTYCVYTGDNSYICFINGDGDQVKYALVTDAQGEYVLTRTAMPTYDDYFEKLSSTGHVDTITYTSQYVGMNYKVKSINFKLFDKIANMPASPGEPLPGAGNYPVIAMELIVSSPQYGDYVCTEYIALYNFYGTESLNLIK